jgi:uncharacterized protein
MSNEVANVLYLVVMGLAWLAIPIGVPGTLIMLAASLLYAWLTGFRILEARDLGWMAGIAVPVEGADQLISIWAARRYGATFQGVLGSLVGGIVGSLLLSPVLPIVGTVLGAFAGAFAGAYLVEWGVQRDRRLALRAAWGGFVGRMVGMILKMVAGGWIFYLAWKALFS